MKTDYDAIIAGAGAAGMMCAAQAAARGLRVLVLDHAEKPGEKIRISGGGRCNFTNTQTAPDRFISMNPHFCKSALARYTAQDFIALVNEYKITWHEKTQGQLFCDGKSQQVIDMLLTEMQIAGVLLRLQSAIAHIEKSEGFFTVTTDRDALTCRKLVIATGGPSIPKMGASGFAYDVARQFGINVIPTRPALVPLTFTDEILTLTKDLSGISVDPAVASCGQKSFREAILFTHRGLSGPAILQISSYWSPGQDISVNLLPETDVYALLQNGKQASPRRKLRNVLSALLPERLAEKIAARCGDNGAKNMADTPDNTLRTAAEHVNAWKLKPNGSEGYRTAEVTAGGVDTDELSAKSFESKKIPGLYFIGECVDVTGWLGGYNFQWAWSSGWCCGQNL